MEAFANVGQRGCFWQLYLAHFGTLIWPTPGLRFAARFLGFRPHR